jgi:hypothetical protein
VSLGRPWCGVGGTVCLLLRWGCASEATGCQMRSCTRIHMCRGWRGLPARRAALEAGYRHIDCAAFYKNQAMVGEGLRGFLEGGRRGELFITSKIWNDEHRPALLRRAAGRPLAGLLRGFGRARRAAGRYRAGAAAGSIQARPVLKGAWVRGNCSCRTRSALIGKPRVRRCSFRVTELARTRQAVRREVHPRAGLRPPRPVPRALAGRAPARHVRGRRRGDRAGHLVRARRPAPDRQAPDRQAPTFAPCWLSDPWWTVRRGPARSGSPYRGALLHAPRVAKRLVPVPAALRAPARCAAHSVRSLCGNAPSTRDRL